MNTIVISPSNVVTFPEGGGHLWVYMQYVKGLLANGCDVYWLEHFTSSGNEHRDAYMLEQFAIRMKHFGLDGKTMLYRINRTDSSSDPSLEWINVTPSFADAVAKRAELLLNFYYAIEPMVLARFKRAALVDIDPGLLQFWISTNQIHISEHDHYLTTGETVGTPAAKFSDCGLPWIHIQPPVSLECWPYHFDPGCEAFSTISTWWGDEWITDGKEVLYENNKRVTFLEFINLPRLTTQVFELALNFGESKAEEECDNLEEDRDELNIDPMDYADYQSDSIQQKILSSHGWRLRHSYEVAHSPQKYRSYIQGSRGEFSCVKPSCLKFQNAWMSDRTICYLASGKPVVIQDTGPSEFLPNGEGMFRFSTLEEAAASFEIINADYENQCIAARSLAETYFDARRITATILDSCL